MTEYSENPDLQHKDTAANLQSLLRSPIQHCPSILTLLELHNYASLLSLQPYQTRRAISHAVVDSILKNDTIISTPDEVNSILEICAVMIRDQKDGGHNSNPFRSTRLHRTESGGGIDMSEFVEEQGKLARIIHLFRNEDPEVQAAVNMCAGVCAGGFFEMMQTNKLNCCLAFTCLDFVGCKETTRRWRRTYSLLVPASSHSSRHTSSSIQENTGHR